MLTVLLTDPALLTRKELSASYQFTDSEKWLLDTVFTSNPYPNRATRQSLADKLAVDENRVYRWFSHKRCLLRKETTQVKLLQRKYIIHYFVHVSNF